MAGEDPKDKLTPEQIEDIRQGLRELDSGQGLAFDEARNVLKSGVRIGDEMEDGTILAGFYEGKPLYATPKDAPGSYTFNQAAAYAKNLSAHNHHDFHVPSEGELNVLWVNRNMGKLKGTFNETSSYLVEWYRSSSNLGAAKRFNDGTQGSVTPNLAMSLRCVR